MNTCRGCGAPIIWARTVNGKAIPLDAEPTPEGNVHLDAAGIAHVHSHPVAGNGGQRFMPHHATCPDVATFRKARP